VSEIYSAREPISIEFLPGVTTRVSRCPAFSGDLIDRAASDRSSSGLYRV